MATLYTQFRYVGYGSPAPVQIPAAVRSANAAQKVAAPAVQPSAVNAARAVSVKRDARAAAAATDWWMCV
ncbi:Hypothetical predicted protein [Pelobates cultripes]|uniref:Uncharacterized protein n=1 Tax=Pelobates cultripes TaxID=61616 RepID=A0AAD1TI67_PELCU|nr:Hypothetical predicted protein [Pelobates cultripes]